MTDNVTPLRPPPEDRIWTCAHCRNQSFFLYEDHTTECALCGFRDHDTPGHWRLRVVPDEHPNAPVTEIVRYGAEDIAKARVIASAKDPEVTDIVVLFSGGAIRCWGDGAETIAKQAWLRERLDDAYKLLTLYKEPTE